MYVELFGTAGISNNGGVLQKKRAKTYGQITQKNRGPIYKESYDLS